MNLNDLNRPVYAGVLPDPKGKPSSADRQAAGLYREGLRRDPPGHWAGNRYLQSQQYIGTQYVAIKATWSWLAGSTVIVEREREAAVGKGLRVRKSTAPGGLGNDDRFHPVDSGDELAALFEDVNPVDTFQDFIAQLVIQIALTGNAHIWLPRNENGKPSELWVLPSVAMQPMPGGLSPEYPFGGWRLSPQFDGLGWGSFGIPARTNIPLDRREVVHYREPHAFLRSDGYGPTQAMARQIDVLNGVETSRASSMAKGVNPSAIITAEGATEDECTAVERRINSSYGGVDKAGKVFVIGSGKGDGIDVEMLGNSPKDMDFPAGWEQSGRAVLAGYRIPPVVAGIIEANYAEFWAAMRAWEATEIGPFATRFSACLTKHVARPCYGRDYRIRLQLPKMNDPEKSIREREYSPNDLRTVNEHRAADDLPPMEGGDVVPSVYAAKQNQALGLGPDGQPLGGDPNDPNGGSVGEDMSGHPLNALGDSILEALGVAGGDGAAEGHPGSGDPFFGGDDQDQGDDVDDDQDSGSSGPGIRHGRDGRFIAGKAFGANRFDEGKHKRDKGKFSSTSGAGGQHGSKRVGTEASVPSRPPALPPAVARHPRILSALKHLTDRAAEIGASVNTAMLGAGLTPDAVIGDAQSWAVYYATAHADALANAIHVDHQTAFAVLSHLAAHGVSAIRRHLKGGQAPEPQPGLARRGPSADNGAVPRPENPGGVGSLPSRLKAFPPVPELDALLAELS